MEEIRSCGCKVIKADDGGMLSKEPCDKPAKPTARAADGWIAEELKYATEFLSEEFIKRLKDGNYTRVGHDGSCDNPCDRIHIRFTNAMDLDISFEKEDLEFLNPLPDSEYCVKK